MYNERLARILAAFGLTSKSKLPIDGMPPVFIDGIKTWIAPRTDMEHKRHRVTQECPLCGSHMSAARMPQHVGTKTCGDLLRTGQSVISNGGAV